MMRILLKWLYLLLKMEKTFYESLRLLFKVIELTVEHNVEKGENAGNFHFFSHTVFKWALFHEWLLPLKIQ